MREPAAPVKRGDVSRLRPMMLRIIGGAGIVTRISPAHVSLPFTILRHRLEPLMIDYRPLDEVIHAKGLRIVLVAGFPSPWSQAAKAIFELKGLSYIAAPQALGEENAEIAAWSGQRNAPVVAWNDEKPVHHWMDILHLAERLAPLPALIPADPMQRALMFGLSREMLGELGVVWNRRLQMLGPAMASGAAPPGVVRMAQSYGCNARDVELAVPRLVAILHMLTAQLKAQYARGAKFFVGDALSAADIYWVTAMNTVSPLPKEQCPIPDDWRPNFVATDPPILAALNPLLLQHRDKIFAECFRNPMEL